MNTLVKKEIRLLLPSWAVALVLAFSASLIADHQSSASYFRVYVLVCLPFLLAPAMGVMLSLDSFGRELSAGTFSNLLAQPVSRARIWWTKTLLLAMVIFSVWAAWWFSVSTNPQLVMNSEQRHEVFTATLVLSFVIFSGGLWTVMLLRQVAAAFWFTLLIPAFLAGLTAHFTGKYGTEDAILGNIVVVLMLYSLAGFFWAQRMFLRAEDVAWTGGNIALPDWLKLPVRSGAAQMIRGPRPRLALIAKEFQLHQSTLVIAGVLAVLHVGVLIARKFGGGFNDSPFMETFTSVFWFFWPVLPLMIGCAAVAEERKLGTLEAQLCLPARRRTQFIVKFGVALALAVFLGVIMPMLFEGRRILPDIQLNLDATNGDTSFLPLVKSSPLLFGFLKFVEPLLPFLPLTLFAVIFVSMAFYASTLARNTLQSIAPAIVGIALCLTGVFGARFVEELVHYPLWRGGLIYLIGVPVLTVTLGALTFWNFKRVLVGWPVWRWNLSVLLVALVAVGVVTTAIYQRAWELLGQPEPPHGVARLTNARDVRLRNHGQRISALLPDGREWSAWWVFGRPELSQALVSGRNSPASLGVGRFLDGTNWISVAQCARDVMALRSDGSLWVSEKPDTAPFDQSGNRPPPREPVKLVRYGDDSDWKYLVDRWTEVLALKADGSLWRIGTNRFDRKNPWRGLRSFTPQRVGTNAGWAELFPLSDHLVFRQTDGRTYVHPPFNSNPGETLKLDEELTLEHVSHFEQNQWRGLIWTSARQNGLFQVGVAQDGRFCVVSQWQSPGNQRAKLIQQVVQLGRDTNWVAVVGSFGAPVTLKSDGTLWVWDISANPVTNPESARATRLGDHADWCAIAGDADGLIALATDGSLWSWQFSRYDSQDLWPLLRPTRRPQLLGNIFAQSE